MHPSGTNDGNVALVVDKPTTSIPNGRSLGEGDNKDQLNDEDGGVCKDRIKVQALAHTTRSTSKRR